MGSQRVGGHVNLNTITETLGFEPEVGETFVAGDLTLRVLSRTIGLEFDDEGAEQWFDRLFIVTAEAVDDVEKVGRTLRGVFGASEESGEDDEEPVSEPTAEARGADAEAAAAEESAEEDGLDEAVRLQIEELLEDL